MIHTDRQFLGAFCQPSLTPLDAALIYADRGWAVLPLYELNEGVCSCRRAHRCQSAGKHPRTRHGVKDASTDVEQIRKWWSQWPCANVGIACGLSSSLLVVDVDMPNGEESLNSLVAENGMLPLTSKQRTGSGGIHYIFRAPKHGALKNRVNVVDGIDIRTDHGYIVAPPSHNIHGQYKWETFGPIAPAPPWIIELIEEQPVLNFDKDGRSNSPSTYGHRNRRGEKTEISLSDAQILVTISRAGNREKFKRLFYQGHANDASSADLSLCMMLAYYTKNSEQIDRLYRQSALFRPKWDEIHSADKRTYGQMTITKAIRFVKTHYDRGVVQTLSPITALRGYLGTLHEAVLYVAIWEMSRNTGYCSASNAALGRSCWCHRRTIPDLLNRLQDAGFVQVIHKDGVRQMRPLVDFWNVETTDQIVDRQLSR